MNQPSPGSSRRLVTWCSGPGSTLISSPALRGVLLTPDPDRAERQRTFLQEALNFAPVLDYTHEVANEHAALLAHVQRTGTPCGPHDLIIAATARTVDRIVLTTDSRARFDHLPEVHARLVTT